MIKKALTPRPLSPKERWELSNQVGSGAYAALQAKHQLAHLMSRKNEDSGDNLKIKIPKEHLLNLMKQSSVKKGGIGELLFNPEKGANTLLGGAAGFTNSSNKFEEMYRQHYQKEIDKAEARYLELLTQKGKKKFASVETPHVDALCHGLIYEMGKTKMAGDGIADGALMRGLSDLLGLGVNHTFDQVSPYSAKDIASGAHSAATLPFTSSALMTYMLRHKGDEDRPKMMNNVTLETM